MKGLKTQIAQVMEAAAQFLQVSKPVKMKNSSFLLPRALHMIFDCEAVQMGHVVVEGVLSEAEETPPSTNNEIKISPSYSIPSSEPNSEDHSCCSDGKQKYAAKANDILNSPESVTNQGESVIVKGNAEDLKDKFTEEEACESIAAKILLSFATCRLQNYDKWHGFKIRIEVESIRPRWKGTGNDKKQYQPVRRGLNSNKRAVK